MTNIQKRIEKAQKNLQRGKIQEALNEYLCLHQEDPTKPDFLPIIADLYLQTNQVEEAVRTYETFLSQPYAEISVNKALFVHRKIIKLVPHDPDKVLALAQFLVHNNLLHEAVPEFQNAAQMLVKANKITAALECYERIVELLPEEVKYREMLGEFAADHRLHAVAERSFSVAAKQRLAQKDSAAALLDFERALKINARNVETLLQIAQLHAQENHWEEVAGWMELAIEQNPLHPDILDSLGGAYLHLRQWHKAETIFLRLFQVHPDAYPRLVNLAQQWIEAGQHSKALALAMKIKDYIFRIHEYPVVIGVLEAVIEHAPNETTAISQLAAIHLSLNHREAYRQCLEKMFDAYMADDNYTVAAEVLDNLISQSPSMSEHKERLERLKAKLETGAFNALKARLEKTAVYRRDRDRQAGEVVEPPRGIQRAVPLPKSDHEILEDLFLQAELFLKYQMTERAMDPLLRLEKLQPLPDEFRARYVELCKALSHPVPATPVAPPRPAPLSEGVALPSTAVAPEPAPPSTRGIQALAAIHRNIHQQQSFKAVLYAAVQELGKFLKVSRCLGALATAVRPTSTYIEYCAPPLEKSEPHALAKLLQHCESTVVSQRRPLLSERVGDDSELISLRTELQVLGIISLAVWPLDSQNQVIGFLGLEQNDVPRTWSGEEILILQTVAEQVAVALNHARLRHLVKTLAVVDEATGLISRHSFFDCLVSEITHAQKQFNTLSLALIELSHMDEVERQRGSFHALHLMRDFSQRVLAHTRETDIVVKFDRSIVALILPETTQTEAAWVARKVCAFAAPTTEAKGPEAIQDSLSKFRWGVAEAIVNPQNDPADAATDVVFRAEQALHQARTASPRPPSPLDTTSFLR